MNTQTNKWWYPFFGSRQFAYDGDLNPVLLLPGQPLPDDHTPMAFRHGETVSKEAQDIMQSLAQVPHMGYIEFIDIQPE